MDTAEILSRMKDHIDGVISGLCESCFMKAKESLENHWQEILGLSSDEQFPGVSELLEWLSFLISRNSYCKDPDSCPDVYFDLEKLKSEFNRIAQDTSRLASKPQVERSAQEISRCVLERYPFPIAYSLRRMQYETDPNRQLLYFIQVFEVIVKLNVITLIAIYLRSNEFDGSQRGLLRKPTLGRWIKILLDLVDLPSIPNFVLAFTSQPDLISHLKEIRNRYKGHGAVLDAKESRRIMQDNLDVLYALLNKMDDVRQYAPFSVVRIWNYLRNTKEFVYEVHNMRGDNEAFPTQRELLKLALRRGSVLLYNRKSQDVIDLSPFVIQCECTHPGCNRKEIVFYDSIQTKDSIRYLSYQTGHQIELTKNGPSADYFYQMTNLVLGEELSDKDIEALRRRSLSMA